MYKAPFWYRLWACLALSVCAMTLPLQKAVCQTDDVADKKPVPPLVATPSGYAHWRIVLTPLAPPMAGKLDPVISEMDFTKSPSMASKVNTWSDGKSSEDWIVEGYFLSTTPNRPDVYLSPMKMRPSGFGNDFNAVYPGFAWLDLKYYKDIVRVDGKKCYHYVDDLARQGWIEVDTKLPVRYSNGSTSGTYEFLAPPTSQLKMPDKFSLLLENYKKASAR